MARTKMRMAARTSGRGMAFGVAVGAGVALALVAGLVLGGCTPKDPKEQLRMSRQGYKVEPLTWVEGPAEEQPGGAQAASAGGGEQGAAEATAGAAAEKAPGAAGETPAESAGEAEAEQPRPKRIAILSVRVTKKTAPLSLPCLTIDVTFEGTNGEHGGPVTVVLPLEGLEDAGGTLELTRRIELPDFPVDHLGVRLHPAKDDAELMSLCEAQAIGGGPSSP